MAPKGHVKQVGPRAVLARASPTCLQSPGGGGELFCIRIYGQTENESFLTETLFPRKRIVFGGQELFCTFFLSFVLCTFPFCSASQ